MKVFYKIIDGKQVFFNGILVIGDRQIINPTDEQLIDDGWIEYVEEEPSEEELIESAKLSKINEIKEYDSSYNVNGFTINGKDMWLNASIRQQLRISIQAYQSLNIENVSKWFDGIEYTFTCDQWLHMLNLLEVYAAEALNVTEMHISAVKKLTNIEDIENYDITGYPEKLSF